MGRFFQKNLGKWKPEAPNEVSYYCCAQFMVTAKLIQKHPKDFYTDFYNWLSKEFPEGDKSRKIGSETWERGMVAEVLWGKYLVTSSREQSERLLRFVSTKKIC